MPMYLVQLLLLVMATGDVNAVAEEPSLVFSSSGYAVSSTGRKEDFRSVFRIDLTKREIREIYTTDFNRGIYKVAYSPQARMVAVACMHFGLIEDERQMTQKIVVLNEAGQVLKELHDALAAMAWSPDGCQLAYVKGVRREKSVTSHGTFIYDMEEGSSRMILKDGFDVYWASFDGRIYVNTDWDEANEYSVWALDPATGQVQQSDYPSLNFSPDGDYYVSCSLFAEKTPIGIFEREERKEITGQYAYLQTEDIPRMEPRWLNRNTILLGMTTAKNFLLFLDTGKTLKATTPVIAVRGETVYLAKPGLKIEAVPLDSLEVVFSEENGILKPEEQPTTEQGAEQKQE